MARGGATNGGEAGAGAGGGPAGGAGASGDVWTAARRRRVKAPTVDVATAAAAEAATCRRPPLEAGAGAVDGAVCETADWRTEVPHWPSCDRQGTRVVIYDGGS